MCSYIDKQKTTKNQYGNTKICIYVNSAWRISIFCVNLEFFTHFLLYRVVKTQSREMLVIFSIRNTLQKFATQTQHDPSLNTQSCNRRPLCSSFTFENVRSPKKTQFYSKKKQRKNLFEFIMQLFSADAIFDPENMKKPPSKVAHNRPPTFFHLLARMPKWPRNRNLIQGISFRSVSF